MLIKFIDSIWAFATQPVPFSYQPHIVSQLVGSRNLNFSKRKRRSSQEKARTTGTNTVFQYHMVY